MFDELSHNLKHFEEELFEESSKSRDLFRTQANICDGAFLWIHLTAFIIKAPS